MDKQFYEMVSTVTAALAIIFGGIFAISLCIALSDYIDLVIKYFVSLIPTRAWAWAGLSGTLVLICCIIGPWAHKKSEHLK